MEAWLEMEMKADGEKVEETKKEEAKREEESIVEEVQLGWKGMEQEQQTNEPEQRREDKENGEVEEEKPIKRNSNLLEAIDEVIEELIIPEPELRIQVKETQEGVDSNHKLQDTIRGNVYIHFHTIFSIIVEVIFINDLCRAD